MSQLHQDVILQSALEREYWMRQNASQKAGMLGEAQRISVADMRLALAQQAQAEADLIKAKNQEVIEATVVEKKEEPKPSKWASTAGLAALIGLGAAGAGAGGVAAYKAITEPTREVQPVPDDTGRVDLIQWMRDQRLDRYPD